MALTSRNNGVAGGLVSAAWWNDYYNLLTGAMSDQPIVVNNGITVKAVPYTAPPAPTLALHAGTNLGLGLYTYAVGHAMGNGQMVPGTTAAITTTSGNQGVSLSAIPTGPAGTTARILYRSKAGATQLYQLAIIGDNTTTVYTDNTFDTSLTVLAPTHDSFGGYLQIQGPSGVVKAEIFNDGAVSFDVGAFSSDGAGNVSAKTLNLSPTPIVLSGGTNGTATLVQDCTGSIKRLIILLQSFRTAAAAQNIVLPVAFTAQASIRTGNIGTTTGFQGLSLLLSGVAQTVQLITSLASTGGGSTPVSTVFGNSIGNIGSGFDTIQFKSGSTANTTGIIVIEGQ